jgi:lipid-binding SYLF domain-containing protein
MNHTSKSHFKVMFTVFSVIALTGIISGPALGKTAKEIDASVDVALERFNEQVEGAEKFAKMAKGVLVMPNVTKGAFVVGAEYGEGALRVGGKSVEYYNTAAGSFGLQIGAQKKDIVLMFMTDEALEKFRNSKGWEAGIDGNVTFINVGGGEQADTLAGKSPVVGFVYDSKGLIADISLKGAKFTKLNK